mmetsp:Transcript_124623/g.240524  ORF Transcript_124623/g.240524 Transcript_124623/m.240524 type:complete len:142 (-) Transcript_124623:321-746(-)
MLVTGAFAVVVPMVGSGRDATSCVMGNRRRARMQDGSYFLAQETARSFVVVRSLVGSRQDGMATACQVMRGVVGTAIVKITVTRLVAQATNQLVAVGRYCGAQMACAPNAPKVPLLTALLGSSSHHLQRIHAGARSAQLNG